MPVFALAPEQVSQPELPTPEILAENSFQNEAVEDYRKRVIDHLTTQLQDLSTGEMVVLSVFKMDYPDEVIQVAERDVKKKNPATGKREPTGEKRITRKTYGSAQNVPLGFVDGDGNLMRIRQSVFATNPAAEAETADDTDIEE